MFSDASSNGFIIDDSPPVVSRGPVFSKDIGIDGKTQFYRTLMKVEWDVSDKDSFIEKQYISLRAHIGGDFDLPSAQVTYFTTVNTVIRFGTENSFLKTYAFICVHVYLDNRSFENNIVLTL